MNISSDMSGVMRDASAKVAPEKKMAASQPAQSSQPLQVAGGNADASPAQVKQMVAEMQSQLDSKNISLQYSLYGEHENKIAVKVVDKETGDVIREIPPKEMQALQAKMGELVGKIFDGKA